MYYKGNSDIAALALRIALGMVIFPHGAQKLLGWFGGHGYSGTMGFFESMGIPAILAFLAIIAEFFGSLGLIAGLLTRLSAFGVAVVMIVAVVTVHAPNGFFMNWAGNQKGEGFEYHLLALGIALALIILGPGRWSLDALLSRSLTGQRKLTPAPAR